MSPIEMARVALGEDTEWLVLGDGAAPGDAVTLDELLADDGRLLEQLVADWRTRDPDDPPEYVAGVVGVVSWMILAPVLAVLSNEGALIRLDSHRVRLGFATDHDSPQRVWWPDDVTVEHADVSASMSELVTEAAEFFAPLVDAVRLRTPVGRRGLWGRVVDTFAHVGPDFDDAHPAPKLVALDAFRQAAAGTVLDQPLEVIDIEHPTGGRQMVRAVACCFAYKAPHHPDDERPCRPWDDGPWSKYCMSCPLIPVDETVERALYWIDHPGDDVLDDDAAGVHGD